MIRVLAVDGGQSGIRVRHSGGQVAELDGASWQEGDTLGSVAGAVLAGWRATGSEPVDRAVLGLTTTPSDEPSRRGLCSEVSRGTGASEVWLADDAVTAHAGALSMGWGVSLTVGTGVACLALPRTGRPRVIGGHGFLLGDEGGGFSIGREGLRAVLRAADGRAEPTALSHAAIRRFGELEDLAPRLHAEERAVDRIARFASDVLDAADVGDAAALRITEEAVRELVLLVRAALAVAEQDEGRERSEGSRSDGGPLPAPNDGRIPLALGGRLLQPGTGLRSRLDAALEREAPQAASRSAGGSPLDGALCLGLAPDPGRYAPLVTVWRQAR